LLKPFSEERVDEANYEMLLSWCDELLITSVRAECEGVVKEICVETFGEAIHILRTYCLQSIPDQAVEELKTH
jgi:hypothetical protein